MDFQLWWGPGAGSTVAGFVVVDFLIRIAVLGFVPHNRRPSAAFAWLVVIFFIPIIGLVIFLLFGKSRLGPRRRGTERRLADRVLGAATKESDKGPELAEERVVPEWALAAVRLNQHNGGAALTAGNRVDLHADYEESIDAVTAAVDRAEASVDVQFYILAADRTTDRFFSALEHARSRGVNVRVLLDQLGSAGFPGYKTATKRLDEAGIPWRRMLPVAPPRFHYQRPDLRNHRKIVVIGDRVGFTGSQNMIDAGYNKKLNLRRNFQWLDLMVRLEGPIVHQLGSVFAADWSAEAGEPASEDNPTGRARNREESPATRRGSGVLCQVLPSGPGLGNENNLRLFNHLVYSAEERVVICSPYFVPDESLLVAVTSAVQRGIDVQLCMGATSDHFLTHHALDTWSERALHQKYLDNACRITANLQWAPQPVRRSSARSLLNARGRMVPLTKGGSDGALYRP
ncbi:phospholipase D-like domain-containing protein [Arthrobacter sp. H41]|uniref:phospholipase D-like domain-containing protein n=1 Tax=Arthrobacter sp. H41 TaxID=1312978 RepID=UPI0004BA9D10|nr:phospholipase D-like domain-containing protein [Arthrobacter sp. H41]